MTRSPKRRRMLLRLILVWHNGYRRRWEAKVNPFLAAAVDMALKDHPELEPLEAVAKAERAAQKRADVQALRAIAMWRLRQQVEP